MFDKSKPSLAVTILSKHSPMSEGIDETKEGMKECVKGLMEAFKSGDEDAAFEHLYQFIELWTEHEEEESPEEEKTEEESSGKPIGY
jgi:hypothetical protein